MTTIDYDPKQIRDPAKILRDAVAFAREPGRHPSIYLTLPLAEKLAEQFERLERLLGYAVTSKRTGFTIPEHWLPDAQHALRYDVPNEISLSEEPVCEECDGRGEIFVGHSGRDDDGNAPMTEPCKACRG